MAWSTVRSIDHELALTIYKVERALFRVRPDDFFSPAIFTIRTMQAFGQARECFETAPNNISTFARKIALPFEPVAVRT
jgi:hypothetical protein